MSIFFSIFESTPLPGVETVPINDREIISLSFDLIQRNLSTGVDKAIDIRHCWHIFEKTPKIEAIAWNSVALSISLFCEIMPFFWKQSTTRSHGFCITLLTKMQKRCRTCLERSWYWYRRKPPIYVAKWQWTCRADWYSLSSFSQASLFKYSLLKRPWEF